MSNLEQFLVFQLGESYGIAVQNVVEVIEIHSEAITRIPRTPNYMMGIINHRGKLVPIISLRLQLDMDPLIPSNPKASIVILNISSKMGEIGLGVLVDSVKEVTEFLPNEVEPAPKIGTKVHSSFIYGMGNKNGNFIILLDIDRIFDIEILANLHNPTLPTENLSSLETIS